MEDFSGAADKFYSGFYGLLLDNLLPSKFEDETVTNILMTEAANHNLIHLSSGSDIVSLQPPPSKKSEHVLADRDFKSLQYIAVYIVHKMYTKFKFSNNYESDYSQQTLSILKACKVEHDDSQTLVNLNDRGFIGRAGLLERRIYDFNITNEGVLLYFQPLFPRFAVACDM